MVFFVAHFLGCSFYTLAKYYVEMDPETKTWLSLVNYDELTTLDKYVNSLYFAIVSMSTIGYGDITPKRTGEKVYMMIFIIISCGIFAYSLNVVTSLF